MFEYPKVLYRKAVREVENAIVDVLEHCHVVDPAQETELTNRGFATSPGGDTHADERLPGVHVQAVDIIATEDAPEVPVDPAPAPSKRKAKSTD